MVAAVAVNGCAVVGPSSIDHGRTSYNEVIEDTSRQQTLLNLVRVSKNESPLFMDVTEVDAATSAGASITGGESGIGAIPNGKSTSAGTIEGTVGAITGTASYLEAPTVRYQPLTGQPLIAQVSTPLTPETLVNLQTSDWPLAAILDLSVDRITKGYGFYDAAVNAIIDLDSYGAVILAAAQTPDKGKSINISSLTFTSSAAPAKDSLALYLSRGGIPKIQASCDRRDPNDVTKIVDVLWDRLRYYIDNIDITNADKDRNSIIIRSKASANLDENKSQPPLLAMRSALGIMQVATRLKRPLVAFLPLSKVRTIIEGYSYRPELCQQFFYTLDPLDPELSNVFGAAGSEEAKRRVHIAISDPNRSLVTMNTYKAILTPEAMEAETVLVSARRFILIAVSDSQPEDAFVAVSHEGQLYSILNDDKISKLNLALIAQFNTIQAIPSQSPPLTPTISVGAPRQ
jgi:hypothetical protein